jgi:CRISPR-associated protein Cas2
MSLHDPARWIVTYDIADARRGARVLRFMKTQGVPLQYSVFIVEASPSRMHALMLELEGLIAPAVDDVRAYRWTTQAESHALGRPLLPEGVLIGAEAATPTRRVVRRASATTDT